MTFDKENISWFRQRLRRAFGRFLGEPAAHEAGDDPPMPTAPYPEWATCEERELFLLTLMPHVAPEALDLFFIRNRELDRPYTVFGGWRGSSHGGFLPTGDTAVFLLSGGRPDDPAARTRVVRILGKDHRFRTENILACEGQGRGEPFLSGRLVLSDELLARLIHRTKYEPGFDASFPAVKIDTPLDWDDLVLPYNLREELEDIVVWQVDQADIRQKWQLDRIVKPGYRCLFYGPPGTGKTLAAMLLGKRMGIDVYRVDLSRVVSKYIGETEKNLAGVFDKARHHSWILFFDEADALFGQRTETGNSNDRHANQEVAYLLQRIEDHPGMVILATNLKDNMDEAFFRRFQSLLLFPLPDKGLRYRLWKRMLPEQWLSEAENAEEILLTAARYVLSGGVIVNAVQHCAVRLHSAPETCLTVDIVHRAIRRELGKEGKITDNTR